MQPVKCTEGLVGSKIEASEAEGVEMAVESMVSSADGAH
jgi:hypothetical protein